VTDEKGAFRLSHFRGGDGAVPGTYKVTLARPIGPPLDVTKVPPLLPPREYERPDKTPLTQTVPEGGGTTDIDVALQPPKTK
jgi:hypothetical protein